MTEESLLSLPEFLTHALDRHIHTCHSCTRNDVCTYVCRGFQVASQMPLPRLEEVLCCCRAGNGDDVVSPQQQFAFDLLPLAPFPTTSGRVKVPRLRVLFQGRMTKMFTRVGGGRRRRGRRLFCGLSSARFLCTSFLLLVSRRLGKYSSFQDTPMLLLPLR